MASYRKFFVPVVLLAALLACEPSVDEATDTAVPVALMIEEEIPEPVELPTESEVLVTFVTGMVDREREGRTVPVDIGDTLEERDIIRVGAGSSCELQYANFAAVLLQENTQVRLGTLFSSEEEARADLRLRSGSILSKVESVVERTRFEVRTGTAVAGVRGTEFLVSAEPSGHTRVAVRSGRVAVLPSSLDAASVRETEDEVSDLLESALDALMEDAALIVEPDQEISMDSQQVDEGRQVFEQIRRISEIPVEVPEDAAPEQQQEIRRQAVRSQAVVQARQEIARVTPGPVTQTEQSRTQLQRVETMRILDLRPPEAPPIAEPVDPESPALEIRRVVSDNIARLVVLAEPEDASIEIDGQFMARGRVAGLYPVGRTVEVRVYRDGFQAQASPVTILDATGRRIRFQLEPVPVAAEPESQPEPITEPEPEPEPVRPAAAPAAQPTPPPPAPDSPPAAVAPEPEPEPVIAGRYRVSGTSIVGLAPAAGNRMVLSDRDGTLYALGPDGRVTWNIPTANTSNENSPPVPSGETVYFSGGREFLMVHLGDGSIISRQVLTEERSHVFGTRVALLGGMLLYPTRSGIEVLQPRSGDRTGTMDIPGGSLMTPSFHGGRIVTVTQDGELIKIRPESLNIDRRLQTPAVQPVASRPTIAGDRVWFADRRGTVFSLDLEAMSLRWDKNIGYHGVFHDLLFSGTGIYVFSRDRVFGLNAENGTELFPALEEISSPPAAWNEYLAVGTVDGRFLLVSRSTGRIAAELSLDSPVSSSPVVRGDRITLGTRSGEIVVVNAGAMLEQNAVSR